jgi:hypothetical protein
MMELVVVAMVAALLVAPGGRAFNLDTRQMVVQASPAASCDRDCMFGFTVAQHSEGGTPW